MKFEIWTCGDVVRLLSELDHSQTIKAVSGLIHTKALVQLWYTRSPLSFLPCSKVVRPHVSQFVSMSWCRKSAFADFTVFFPKQIKYEPWEPETLLETGVKPPRLRVHATNRASFTRHGQPSVQKAQGLGVWDALTLLHHTLFFFFCTFLDHLSWK